MFPAYAGVSRAVRAWGWTDTRVPRLRGGEPPGRRIGACALVVFPAYAGVSLCRATTAGQFRVFPAYAGVSPAGGRP